MPYDNVRIVHREGFSLLGYSERMMRGPGIWPATLDIQWDKVIDKGFAKTLDNTRLGGGLYGAYIDCTTDGGYGYMVGCEVVPGTREPEGLTVVDVPPMDYAVNRSIVPAVDSCDEVGPLLIALHDWLKSSPYQQGSRSRLAFYEFYKNPDKSGLSAVEIWIPIVKR